MQRTDHQRNGEDKKQPQILRSGILESRGGSSRSSSDVEPDFESDFISYRHGTSGTRSVAGSTEATRAFLAESTRRYDRKTMALVEASLEKYNYQRKFTYFSDRTDILQGDTLHSIGAGERLESLQSEPFFWIDLNGFTEVDLSQVATSFGVHPLTIEDIQMQDNREKCEIFEHYIFICIRTLDQQHQMINAGGDAGVDYGKYGALAGEPVNVYMIIFRTHIITVHQEAIMNIRSVLRRIYPLRNLFELSSDWVAYALIDDVVDEFMPGLRRVEFEVDSIDDLVLVLSQSDQAEMLRRIGRARKRVTHLMRLLKPKTEVLRALGKRCPDRLKPHTLLYLRDIQDHLLTMVHNLDHYSETLNRSHNNYLAQISIELNAASNRMDNVVKKLTGAAFFLLPLSLISSIWGMNIPVPGDDQFLHNYIPFFVIITGMAGIVLVMFFFARKYDWL